MPQHIVTSATEQKRVLRDRLRATPIEDAGKADQRIAAQVSALLSEQPSEKPPEKQMVLAGYWPITGEVDCRPMLAGLADRFTLCLPVVSEKDAPLTFRQWRVDEPLIKGRYGIPIPDEAAARVVPDILLIPMVGFDADGFRLGMGGGFYDRTLAGLAALTIGLCYTARRVARLPREPHDRPLDWIVTEEGAMSCTSTSKSRG